MTSSITLPLYSFTSHTAGQFWAVYQFIGSWRRNRRNNKCSTIEIEDGIQRIQPEWAWKWVELRQLVPSSPSHSHWENSSSSTWLLMDRSLNDWCCLNYKVCFKSTWFSLSKTSVQLYCRISNGKSNRSWFNLVSMLVNQKPWLVFIEIIFARHNCSEQDCAMVYNVVTLLWWHPVPWLRWHHHIRPSLPHRISTHTGHK